MKHFPKLTALLLAALMLSPMTACSETTVTDDPAAGTAAKTALTAETSDPSADIAAETEERLRPDIPETGDFGDDDIHFMFWKISFWESGVHESRDIYAEGYNGEAINDAVFDRNVKIEDAYKVKISLDILEYNTIVSTIDNCVRSGDATYDVVYPRLVEATPLFSNNSLLNLNDVPNIDLSMPWWDGNCAEAMTVYGYLPCVATSINVNDKDASSAMVFNKGMRTDFQLEDPYTLVREGTWTIDKSAEMASVVNLDLNSNGTMDQDDRIGFLGCRDVMESFYYGSGSRHTSPTEDGGFAFTYGTESDINVTQRILDLMKQNYFVNTHVVFGELQLQDDIFGSGENLLAWIKLAKVTDFRALDTDFGILPVPKYTEEQDNYYSMVSRHSTGLLSIPNTISGEKLEQLGIVLEALAAESHYTVIPEYIEVSLKTKHSRDAESAEMLDIIISSRMYDPLYYYNLGSFSDQFLVLGEDGNDNVASFIKSREKMMKKTVERFLKTIQDNIDINAVN